MVPHDNLFPFVPGTTTITKLLLTKLIETLSGTAANKKPTASDVPALIRQVQTLLHKQNMLPSDSSIPNNMIQLKRPLPTSKGGPNETVKRLQAILNRTTNTGNFPSAPSGEPTDRMQASSIPTSRNQTKLQDTISKGGTNTTKQKQMK